MSALIKLAPKYKYLNLPIAQHQLLKQTKDLMGVHIPAFKATLLSGDEAGKEVSEVKMNQLVKVYPAVDLRVTKYTVLLGYNPKLAELGIVNCSPFLPAGEEVSVTIKAFKNFNLDNLDYVFTLYLLD